MLQNERRCNPMKKDRLIALTDAVLAIIMTILILELEKPTTPSLQAFWDLRQNFFAYFLSFFWLGSLWMALNTLWEKVEKISSEIIWWNLFLLLERQEFSLLELNIRVKGAVLNAFPETCWVRAEMSDVRTNAASGHCYLEFIEKNAITGQLVAKARGSIWAKTFRMLKP